ncbi:hypothetical protein TorRG33x02_174210 [Trema orientale]|uniref:Uncharacterized protein n=1 Tax=Trema orientale TaxID=63057 RepID=A0A2P5EMP9_TREOI|nr:hypothetical protein TorRG33x02_174210 [Trema orientale]
MIRRFRPSKVLRHHGILVPRVIFEELFTASGSWNRILLNQLFDDVTSRAILKIPVLAEQGNGAKWM